MTKEYIGEAFRAPYYEAMAAWYAGEMQGPSPDTLWETLYEFDVNLVNPGCPVWVRPISEPPPFSLNTRYRFKPAPKRMVTMYTKTGPVELVAPERKALARGTTYFLTFISGVEPDQWTGTNIDQERLASGKIFLTREDAQAMADFQRKQRLGDV